MSVIDRCLFPLQAIDVGGKCGYINPDEKTAEYVRSLPGGGGKFELFRNDADVRYAEIVDIDVSKIEPQVACPPTVGNVKPIDAAVGTPIDVAEAGGSTGGRLSDIRTLAKCFANAKVHPGVRLQVVPATRGIYLAALQEGLFETLYKAGANIFPRECRLQPGIQHGRAGRGRSHDLDAGPQFSGPQRASQGAAFSGLGTHRRRVRHQRQDHRSALAELKKREL